MLQKETMEKFTPLELKYIEILANPELQMTDEQIAQELGVSRSTIARMKKRKELSEVASEMFYNQMFSKLPKVYNTLVSKAISGNLKAIELTLKFLGKYTEKSEVKVEATIEADKMTDHELQKAMEEMERLKKLSGEGTEGNE